MPIASQVTARSPEEPKSALKANRTAKIITGTLRTNIHHKNKSSNWSSVVFNISR